MTEGRSTGTEKGHSGKAGLTDYIRKGEVVGGGQPPRCPPPGGPGLMRGAAGLAAVARGRGAVHTGTGTGPRLPLGGQKGGRGGRGRGGAGGGEELLAQSRSQAKTGISFQVLHTLNLC